MSVKGLRTHRG